MGVDYYALLDVKRDASLWEIKLAYRKLALRLHPMRKQYQQHPNPQPDKVFDMPLPALSENVYWGLLNEAYDVLSDDLRREVFNNYGEEGLKRGVPAPNGYVQPYCYHNDPMRTYFEVFGSNSPYSDLIDAVTNPPPLYKVKQGFGVIHKDPEVSKLLYLSLEDVYFGCTKLFNYKRKEFVDDLKIKTEDREAYLAIHVCPGCFEGTKIIFNEAWDQSITRKPGDVVFITSDIPHKLFRRDKIDLHMDYSITLKQALAGFKMQVLTVDDRKLEFNVTDIVSFDYEKCIKSEGLPHPDNNYQRGNLIIHFKIQYPKVIPKHLRLKVEEIFNEIEENEKLQDKSECESLADCCTN
ncbi:hypothetical protein ACKWTF_004035 [Chironomus riparius]